MCTGVEKNGVRGAGSGVREGVPLMRHEYIWGFSTGGYEKLVQVETFKAPQAYYKTIIPKNPKKGALTPGSIF
jgi:hypothetical protein